MSQTIEAIYQNGMFKPLNPVPEEITEGKEVILNIKTREESANEIMKAAENFYEGLSDSDIAEIENVMLDRSNFFGDRKS